MKKAIGNGAAVNISSTTKVSSNGAIERGCTKSLKEVSPSIPTEEPPPLPERPYLDLNIHTVSKESSVG